MKFAAIIDILALIAPAILAFSGSLIKGNKRFIIAIAVFFILKRFAVIAAEQEASSNIGGNNDNPGYINVNALATQFKQSMNPSGFEWSMGFDGTVLSTIYELAGKAKGRYSLVFDSYRAQFKRDLTKDLISELSTDEYNKFLSILNS